MAAVSFLARYAGRTHALYSFQLREWFTWCETNDLDPLVGVQRAHVELYIRQLGERGLMDSSVVTMMHAVRGYFRFAHVDGLIAADPAVYARLPKTHRDESRTPGLDRLELIRFLQVARTLTVHNGALAYVLGINALRASDAAAALVEGYADTLQAALGHHRHDGCRPSDQDNKADRENRPRILQVSDPVLATANAETGTSSLLSKIAHRQSESLRRAQGGQR